MTTTASRPTYSTRATGTTIVSSTTTSYNSDYQSNATTLTALTIPDPGSPPFTAKHKLAPLSEVQEESGSQLTMDERYAEEKPRRISMDLSRGPSVRDRASQWEQSNAAPSTRRPLPMPEDMARTRSTSPLRVRKVSANTTPTQTRRIPVPATAPIERLSTQRRTYEFEVAESTPVPVDRLSSPRLTRGSGSARKMIQQWENNLPSTPSRSRDATSAPMGLGARTMSREYLDQKPLPIPQATPILHPMALSPSRAGPSHSHSPARSTYAPSPLQHLQTPTQPNRKRSATLSPSPSSYSLSPSPSGERRKKNGGRSPLKEMLNKFGGGIQAISRKAKGKSKDKGFARSPSSLYMDDYSPEERMGTNGLPGGIVFSDRMGAEEMGGASSPEADVVRSSAAMYLIPTPCSSVSPWGSWLSSWVTLTSTSMRISYCPVFQPPQSGQSTPRRVFSGSNPTLGSTPAVAFSQIPQPSTTTVPDVAMAMKDCVEVRSLRRDEVRGRGIPPVPEGVGTEVLEMAWSDGSKRYIGVEGVAGRLGWVSAIWDVLLVCKSTQTPLLPPPSPMANQARSEISLPLGLGPARIVSDSSLVGSRNQRSSHPPPVQKMGDEWVAGSSLDMPTSDLGLLPVPPADKGPGASDTITPSYASPGPQNTLRLRDSVQRMFDMGPDLDLSLDRPNTPSGRSQSSEMSERIKAWQPSSSGHGHEDLSAPVFSRTNSGRSDKHQADVEYRATETMLSFDPADLNPSRSASQVRRPASTVIHEDRTKRYGMVGVMPVLDERSTEGGNPESTVAKTVAPTHISHVTFPKPAVGGVQMTAHPSAAPGLPTIRSSATSSSCETRPSTEMQTPRTDTRPSSITTLSSVDPTVLAKLDTHSNEHGTLTRKIDGVQGDLHTIITSLGGLVQQTKSAQTAELAVPKLLDDKLSTIQLDVKNIENALQLSQLAVPRIPSPSTDDKMAEVHQKLDNIAKLCQEVLTRGISAAASTTAIAANTSENSKAGDSRNTVGTTLSVSPSQEEKSAGEEVAQIMADLTGGSSKNSPRLVGLQVLHNVSAPPSPKPSASAVVPPSTPPLAPLADGGKVTLPDEVTKQVGEVLGLVTELKEARSLQTQQTTDIARYLNELNTWLEKFVHTSSSELSSMSKRLNILVGSAADEPGSDGHSNAGSAQGAGQPGLPDLVADMHHMISEQKQRNESEGLVGHRVDALLAMMGEERERQAGQQNTVEQVVSILERQRQDNEMLLRAVATDLSTEIRGERMRFIEAMQQATSVNVAMHVEEFKKLLSAEVNKSMAELGQMREEKKVLEQQISDLFALMAKHGGGKKAKAAVPGVGRGLPPPGGVMSPGAYPRGLPAPPH
ncbi:hypothetical protein IAU60_006526 [Kwoniella sp. DSM 27419]